MTPELETRPAQPYVSIPVTANFQEWGQVNALVPELYTWLGDREPAGAPFYRYYVIGGMTDRFELEVGIPVRTPLPGDERVRPGAKPAGTYAVLTHEGHPDGIAETHLTLVEWAAAQDVRLAKTNTRWEALFESYLTNPEDEPDMTRWRTELAYLVTD